MKRVSVIIITTLVLFTFCNKEAGTVHLIEYKAELNGANMSPANLSLGTATAIAKLDTVAKTLSVKVTYSNINPVTIKIHSSLNGSTDGPELYSFGNGPFSSPVTGKFSDIPHAHEALLNSVKLSIKITSAVLPAGEIRGLFVKQ